MRVRRRSTEPLVRKHVSLFEGDFEKLGLLFPQHSQSVIIRNLVRGLIKRTEEAAAERSDKASLPEGMKLPTFEEQPDE